MLKQNRPTLSAILVLWLRCGQNQQPFHGATCPRNPIEGRRLCCSIVFLYGRDAVDAWQAATVGSGPVFRRPVPAAHESLCYGDLRRLVDVPYPAAK